MITLAFLGKKSDLDSAIQDYGKRIKLKAQIVYQKKFEPSSKIVFGCDERGEKLDSVQFLGLLEKYQFNVDIVVGADDGIPDIKYTKLINLAPFVMAHDIARLVLTEQVYRALSIYEGHPYHRA